MIKLSTCFLAAAAAVTLPLQAAPLSLEDIATALERGATFDATARFEVMMASHSEPVQYTVGLQSRPAPGDTLSPCKYLIEWSLDTPSGAVKGFSTYFDGAHFRFRGHRLQEYHASDDPQPFAPGGDTSHGVQQQVQFADLLPAFMAARLRAMAADTTYISTVVPDTLYCGRPATVVKGVRRINGYDGLEYTYVFDRETLLPVHTSLETSPGGIGEQCIDVSYSAAGPILSEIDMESLVALESDAFEKYRESSFTLDNLPGRPMPQISAPTSTGERYFHGAGEPFASPTLVVFVDAGVGTTPELVKAVRMAEALSSARFDVIWAFLNHRAEDVEEIISAPEPGETLLIHAGGAARDAGVGAVTPVFVLAGSDGTVSDVIRGFNNDIAGEIIQKVAAMYAADAK